VDALGRETFYDYDSRGNLIRTEYPDGSVQTATFDAENQRISSTDRNGNTTYYIYDALGRKTDTIHPDTTMPPDPGAVTDPASDPSLADNPRTTTVYDAIGRTEATFDELGQGTFYEYDPNCGCSGRRATITNALNEVTTFAYDAGGNQVSVTDAKNQVTGRAFFAIYPKKLVPFGAGMVFGIGKR